MSNSITKAVGFILVTIASGSAFSASVFDQMIKAAKEMEKTVGQKNGAGTAPTPVPVTAAAAPSTVTSPAPQPLVDKSVIQGCLKKVADVVLMDRKDNKYFTRNLKDLSGMDANFFEEVKSSEAVLKYAEATIPIVCGDLVYKESKSGFGRKDFTGNCFVLNDDSNFAATRELNTPEIKAKRKIMESRCVSEIDAKMVVASNTQMSAAYNLQLSIEKNAALTKEAEIQHATNLEVAKQTVRNFEVKDLNLRMTKDQVLLKGGTSSWNCAPNKEDPAFESCAMNIASEECVDQDVISPATGRRLTTVTNCRFVFPDPKTLTPGMKSFATLGGARVERIYANFFNRTVSEYRFHMETASPDLESGLVEKYGKPIARKAINNAEWVGKDEVIRLNGKVLTLFKPSALEVLDNRKKQRSEELRAENERLKKQRSEHRKTDL